VLDFNHHYQDAQILSKTKSRSQIFITCISAHFLWIKLCASGKIFAKPLILLEIEVLLKNFAALKKSRPAARNSTLSQKSIPFQACRQPRFFAQKLWIRLCASGKISCKWLILLHINRLPI